MDYFHLSAGQDTMEHISALGLAHLGDGVYELMVRSWLCLHGKATNAGLHKAAVPKGASVGEYHAATALESLFGWLYLQGKTDRLNELFDAMMEEANHAI